MSKHLPAFLLSLGLTAPLSGLAQPADLVLHNAEVYTPDGWASAVAVRDGVITRVGADEEILGAAGDATRVMDLDGATVFPGLHDLHVHPLGAGQYEQSCSIPQGSSRERLLSIVGDCVAEAAPGEWVSGGQWDAASFGEERMHRRMLDEIAPDNPVSLVDISGHSLWVNSRALELAGIDEDTQNPPGGIIERGPDGTPTGVLRESAAGLVRAIIPPPDAESVRSALQWALDRMVTQGITSITDAGVRLPSMQAYAELADQDQLKLRVRACMMLSGALFGNDENGMPSFLIERQHYARERFRPDCIKLALDGVPTDGHTAAMVEPYVNTDHLPAEESRGILMVPQLTLNQILVDADQRGFVVKMHAAGDGAVRAGLDAIEAARQVNGYTGLLHNLAHNSFVQPDDIARARGLGATFEMSPYIWFPNPIIPDIATAVGEQRMRRWIPVKDAIEAGALVVPGSDWPVVPNFNPWVAMETLVTRRQPGGDGEPLGASQRISLQQAVDMYTVNAAQQTGHRDRLGTIEPGMIADLIVLDRNPFDIPVTEIHRTQVVRTLIGGEIVWDAMQAQGEE